MELRIHALRDYLKNKHFLLPKQIRDTYIEDALQEIAPILELIPKTSDQLVLETYVGFRGENNLGNQEDYESVREKYIKIVLPMVKA